MKLKIWLLVLVLTSIILLSLFGFGVKKVVLGELLEGVPEYNCGEEGLCTGCIIDGEGCNCGAHTCDCGNKTVDKEECSLLGRNSKKT